jgi:hypothetical protein
LKSALELKKGLISYFFDGECKDTLQKVEKSLKKVLTKQNVCDKINKLSYEKRKRRVRAQDLEN